MIKRVEYVYERLLELVPVSGRKDARYRILKSIMKDSLKDIALIPDTAIIPLMREAGQAFLWIAEGSYAELEAWLEENQPEGIETGESG